MRGVFEQLWTELGGTLTGGVRDGTVPDDARELAVIESPTLAEMVRDINKFSNNVMARQLFLTMGAESRQAAGAQTRTPTPWCAPGSTAATCASRNWCSTTAPACRGASASPPRNLARAAGRGLEEPGDAGTGRLAAAVGRSTAR